MSDSTCGNAAFPYASITSMKTRSFRFYSDPGHGWVRVPIPFLVQIIGADWRKVFTPFSYERGTYVYLEEDEDAARFIQRSRAAGIEPVPATAIEHDDVMYRCPAAFLQYPGHASLQGHRRMWRQSCSRAAV